MMANAVRCDIMQEDNSYVLTDYTIDPPAKVHSKKQLLSCKFRYKIKLRKKLAAPLLLHPELIFLFR